MCQHGIIFFHLNTNKDLLEILQAEMSYLLLNLGKKITP